ncbi:MAG: SMC-Scp complex subunit ScpB [Anaerolineae bacterium]|nr:SMC-Scp complex subunit ScpB [Anaerolineae bacterium]
MTTDKNDLPLSTIVEGLLFVATEPVTVRQIAAAIDCKPEAVETALAELKERYQNSGIRLQRQGQKIQMVSAPELTEYIEEFLGLSATTRLSTPALETLAMVAYRQPITRPEIEAIRGVNSDGVLRTLISKGLVEEVGRLDTVGHPAQFGTTFEFLRYFGIADIEDLPELNLPALVSENGTGESATESPEDDYDSQEA